MAMNLKSYPNHFLKRYGWIVDERVGKVTPTRILQLGYISIIGNVNPGLINPG